MGMIKLDGELLVRLCIWLQALGSALYNRPVTIEYTWLQDAIRRVQDLEKMGHLSGVMDDRGKVGQHLFWLRLRVVIVHNPMS